MKELIRKSILAGILIGFAGWIFLACQSLEHGKLIGSFLFGLGLCGVILFDGNLVTGKFGYMNSWQKVKECGLILLFNAIAAFLVGLLYKACNEKQLIFDANTIMASRHSAFNAGWDVVLFKGIVTGTCIYFAVEGYKKSKSLLPVILGVMAFILSGSFHCIADCFYAGACELCWQNLIIILITTIGNAIGSLIIRLLQVGIKDFKK